MEAPLPTSDPEPRTWDRPSGRLTFVDEGPPSGHALFALHGIPGSVRDFRYLAPLLTPSVRLLRVDLPGFGGSAPDEAAVRSLEGRGQAVLDLADHLGIARFGLVGHSMGGGPALLLAARAPARVSHLVLLASVGLRRHRGLGQSLAAFSVFGRALHRPLLGALLTPVVRWAYRRRRFPGAERMTARELGLHLRSIGALSFDELGRAAAAPLPPTLVAWCRDDHMLEPAIAEELASRIPGARRLAFETGGHNFQKTRAPEVAAAILDLVR